MSTVERTSEFVEVVRKKTDHVIVCDLKPCAAEVPTEIRGPTRTQPDGWLQVGVYPEANALGVPKDYCPACAPKVIAMLGGVPA